ncbi:hypothetical protein [Streptantibioticus cattleyicolor]|nr:hypothetical protein [Streptantibioticus cattleyicolor]CCB72190.1 exported protein of unknown function [Streptantibioticus cattleyicolor NRRL 8057 = DSM 46488]
MSRFRKTVAVCLLTGSLATAGAHAFATGKPPRSARHHSDTRPVSRPVEQYPDDPESDTPGRDPDPWHRPAVSPNDDPGAGRQNQGQGQGQTAAREPSRDPARYPDPSTAFNYVSDLLGGLSKGVVGLLGGVQNSAAPGGGGR